MQSLTLKAPPSAKIGRRISICRVWDIPLGLGRAFQVEGRSIAVFKARDGKVFAVDGICPHKGGPLADGMIVGHQVVCPLHSFRFEADTGTCDQPGECSIAAHPLEVEGDTVFLLVS